MRMNEEIVIARNETTKQSHALRSVRFVRDNNSAVSVFARSETKKMNSNDTESEM